MLLSVFILYKFAFHELRVNLKVENSNVYKRVTQANITNKSSPQVNDLDGR